MKYITSFPEVTSISELSDLIFRAAWHFDFLEGFTFNVLTNKELSIEAIKLPDGFSTEAKEKVASFVKKLVLTKSDTHDYVEYISNSTAIIKWVEDDVQLNIILKKHAKCTIYRVDPKLVRQEGSFYIQCAYDLLLDKENLILESKNKFMALKNELGNYKESWLLATGPSVDNYIHHNFDDALTIACNSTVLDNELMKRCNPKILVFADPIFHFGISQYAQEFRKIVADKLKSTDITVIIPFKYYALLCSIFPQYKHRIIGVPLDASIDFNSDISESFSVKSTANILTLLLLPVATTFSDSVNILGCDGRPFEEDDYFWGHGKTVQINSKMDNIQQVHPGFFKIDYNEYYFEHCHTLECLMRKGESEGKTFKHHANSFIPALRDRNESYKLTKSIKGKHVLLIEPDGIGVNGHYVPWYNQVLGELDKHNTQVTVLCNLKQDPALYNSKGINVFTSHSWGISRGDWCFKKGYETHASFIRFFDELESAAINYCKLNNTNEITFFMYYGSTQILSGFHAVIKKLKALKIKVYLSICLFHESVILNSNITEPRLPPNARSVLLEALSQSDSYTVTSVTKALQDYIYKKVNVQTLVMPNPIPNGITENDTQYMEYDQSRAYRIVFPCALREEKGGLLVTRLIQDIIKNKVNKEGFHFFVRRIEGVNIDGIDCITWIENNISDEEYDSLLSNADSIVIPYLAPHFTYRTSGIVVDAMAAKKPIIVMEDTWLADVVKANNAGIAIRYYSSSSFMSALVVFRSNQKLLSKYSKVSFERYHLEHSWMSLVKKMLLQ